MTEHFYTFIYGAIGGGIVTVMLRLFETYVLAPRLTESLESRKKLLFYGRPLWRACYDLHYRLHYIKQAMNHGPRPNLEASPRDAKSLDWFTTKEGNYICSTAYMIAVVAAWVVLYERDTVFLYFGRRSLTAQFLVSIERFKDSISRGSILWFNYYVDGIGEKLIEEKENKIMSYSSFCHKLFQDKDFLDYYAQLFEFLHQVNQGEFESNIANTLIVLNDLQHFLISNNIVVKPPKELGPSVSSS